MNKRVPAFAIYSCFTILVLSLFYSQIVRFGYYSKLARNNVIRIIPIYGPRGNIFDRNNNLVVTNRISFNVAVVYQELKDKKKLLELLNESLGISKENIAKKLESASITPYAPVAIFEDIGKDKAIMLEEASFDIRGLVIETKAKRYYVKGDIGCHIFGYLGEISEEELERLRPYGYQMKDLIGRDGLEKYYDRYLAGTDGGLQIEVDNRGRQTRLLGVKEPTAGKDLFLTIDSSLQEFCDRSLGEKRGAVIVMNPKNGDILALASHPTFDPNLFVRPGTSQEKTRLLQDKAGRPLSNRAISGLYEPGSIFKVVVASGALETKSISERTTFKCEGSYRVGNTKFNCWRDTGHGLQDVTEGLMNSCNVFFYNTGRALGVDGIESSAKRFGFGKATGIDLPDEAKGIVPGRLWKRQKRKGDWYEGETVNYSIGQGYLMVTPIQVLEMMAIIANRGDFVRPHIVKRIESAKVTGVEEKNIGLSFFTIQKVREGLFKVVNSENGTGRRSKLEDVFVAGKTGTAENPQGDTHAWFSGFAPYRDPKICVVVFLEHGGKGGLEPADIAKGIFEEAKAKGYL